MADLVWSDPDPDKEDFAISPRFVLSPHLRCAHTYYSILVGRDTHSAQASSKSS